MKKNRKRYIEITATAVVMALALTIMLPRFQAAQLFSPARPEDEGVIPLTDAKDLNTDVVSSDDNLEQIDVDITSDDQIIICWEDDSAGIAAGIRVYDMNLTNRPWADDYEGNNVSSYYFDDGEPTDDNSGWGPKVKANYFGDGFGMGSSAWGFPENSGRLVESLSDLMKDDEGRGPDSPCVQIYQADMTPILPIICGITDEFAQPQGSVRIADWCYLSNGNIAIAGESHQNDAHPQLLGMSQRERAVTLAVLKLGKQFPDAVSRLHEADGRHEMQHGLAPLADGFVARFNIRDSGVFLRAFLRYFANDGKPITGDIDLRQFSFVSKDGLEVAGVLSYGGRGDSVGFDSNARDRVVLSVADDIDGIPGHEIYAGVFDAQGNLITGPIYVNEGYPENDAVRCDAAIATDGSFIIVWDDIYGLFGDEMVLARIFHPDGAPATRIFSIDNRFDHITNKDIPEGVRFRIRGSQPGISRRPRVTWRDNLIVVAWESTNGSPDKDGPRRLSARVFTRPAPK